MPKVGWDAISKWRDSRMGEGGDLWHRGIIDPGLLSLLDSVRGLRVLDVGCGNGYLTRRFMRQGATRAVGVDASIASIRLARAREARRRSGAEFVHGDAARLSRFATGSFDRVVANMSLMDIRDAAATIREAGRVLAPDGRFVFSISHPCFDVDLNSTWVVERRPYHASVARKVEGYRRERRVRVPWKVSETEMAYTDSYHRTLATYAHYLYDAGLAILRLVEPRPSAEVIRKSEQGPFMVEIPLHLVVEAGRVPRPGRRLRRGAAGSRRSR